MPFDRLNTALIDRTDLPVWVLTFLGLSVLGLFMGIQMFGPDYVAVPLGEDSAKCDSLKEALQIRGIDFITTESELWIPRRELDRIRADPSLSIEIGLTR